VTLDPEAGEQIARICAEYDAAWVASGQGKLLPPIETYVSRMDAPYQEALQRELEQIRLSHRNRQTMTDGGRGSTAEQGPASGRADTAQAASDGTLEFIEPSSPARAQFDHTIDHPGSVGADSKLLDAQFSLDEKIQASATSDQITVPGYEIVGELGRGGMGVVYKARQLGLNRWVALKMVLAGAHAGEIALARFRVEAEAVAGLQHPNIVQIYDVGRHNGLPYFSLEFVDGGSLSDKVHRQPQPPRDAAHLVETLARAMGYAHQHGIIHRDLKPANVLLTKNGIPKITDFGLAKRLEGDSSQTKSGTLLGTPSYMAPEQARGEIHQVGPPADIYALGAMLYELLTGRPPFQAATAMETLLLVTRDEAVPVSRLQANIPRDLETICLKCLQKETAKRYATAEQLAEDLRRFLSGEPIRARPVSGPERLWRWCKRNPKSAFAAATIFVLLTVVSVGSTYAAFKIRAERNRATENERIATRNEKIANEQADLALETVNTVIKNVQRRLGREPNVQPLRRDLLRSALESLKRVASNAGNEGTKQRNMGDAFLQMGILAREFGDSEEAYDYFERCYDLTKKAVEAEPDNDRWKVLLSAACMELGMLSTSARRDMQRSLAYYEENVKLREAIAARPDAERRKLNEALKSDEQLIPFLGRLYLSEAYLRVALFHYLNGDSAQAEAPVLKCLAIREKLIPEIVAGEAAWTLNAAADGMAPVSVLGSVPFMKKWLSEQQQNLARTYHLTGEIYFRLQDRDKSNSYYAKVAEMREAALRDDPSDYKLLGDLAEFYTYYGNVDFNLGNPKGALPRYDRSIELGRKIVATDSNVQFVRNLGTALYYRGLATARMNDKRGAAKFFEECLKIREDLAQKDRKSEEEKTNLMILLPQFGRQDEAEAIAESVRVGRDKDPEMLITIARGYAECAATVSSDSTAKRGYEQKAVAALQSALASGYKDLTIIETDPDLQPLHDLPEFKTLLNQARGRTAASRR
jgi:serine/threonine-protein kinase